VDARAKRDFLARFAAKLRAALVANLSSCWRRKLAAPAGDPWRPLARSLSIV